MGAASMKARIKVESFDTSMWGGMQPQDQQESVYEVAPGDSIDTASLGHSYQFEITAIRPDSVDLFVRPNLWLQAPEQNRVVGALTLKVGEQANLQTQSFDAWGNWVVLLAGVL